MTGSAALTDLLARLETAAPKPVAVSVPGVGTMFVLPLTVRDMDEASAEAMKATSRPEQIARNVARILCDADGVRFPCVDEAGVELPAYKALVDRLMGLHWEHSQSLLQAAAGAINAGNV